MPTAAQVHNLTDKLSAYLQKDLDGFVSELGAATTNPLATILDGVGDQYMEGALMNYALAVDTQSQPASYSEVLATILARPAYREFARQWQAFLETANGGSTSLDALLTALSAQLHPLAGELFRAAAGGQDSFLSAANVFSPTYGVASAARVYTGADGALAEDTTDALDVGTADVPLFAADDHCLYVGYDSKFSQLIAALSTAASATIVPTFQYWNGSAWVTLSVTDNSVGFTLNDTLKWTPPSDWRRCAADAGGTAFADLTPRYYVRISRTANSITAPTATMLRLVPVAIVNASSAHLGVPQPPLALVRITGSGTVVVEQIVDPAFARFNAPAVRFRALTPGLSTPTLTVSYTDQGGASNTQAQSALTSPSAGDTIDITLASPDTGVQSILTTGWVVTSGVQGVLAVEVASVRTPAL